MKPVYRGVLIGVLQCLMALSVAGKYAWERATLPRVWLNATPVDPSLPLRGRYISMHLRLDLPADFHAEYQPVRLRVENSHLVAEPVSQPTGLTVWRAPRGTWQLNEPVAFFISESVPDPSLLKPGEELWVEVSVPKSGPPRPLRLALKHDGQFTPLSFN